MTFEPADPRSADAARLIAGLSAELSRRYDFADDGSGHFRPEDVLVPGAVFLIGKLDGVAVACGALRPMGPAVVEVKRMYVEEAQRGKGLGKQVLAELERRAAGLGYHAVRLETGQRQPEAVRLYEGAGYRRIEAFGVHVGNIESICFEKLLR
jgi:putative acetyltransferase